MNSKPAVALDPMPDPAELRAAAATGLSLLAWRAAGRPMPLTKKPGVQQKPALRPWHPYRSKWEADYARTQLAVEKAAGLILDFEYETERLEIGVGAFYTPDFPVRRLDGGKEYREVKGYRRESAMVRIKAAALRYPDRRFVLVSKINGQWQHTTIGAKP